MLGHVTSAALVIPEIFDRALLCYAAETVGCKTLRLIAGIRTTVRRKELYLMK